MLRRTLAITALVLLPVPASAAERWDPFPPLLPSENVAVQPALDDGTWAQARLCLRTQKPGPQAAYFAGVVKITDAGGRTYPVPDAVPYVDALYQAWKPLGRLDPDRHVLIALGLTNRAVAIHPGSRFAELGFKGPVIKSTIDGSDFARFAKSGDYARAVCALRDAIDTKLQVLVREEAANLAAAKVWLERLSARREALYGALRAAAAPWADARIDLLKQRDEDFAEASRRLADGRLASAQEAIDRIALFVSGAEQVISIHGNMRVRLAEAQNALAASEPALLAHPLWGHSTMAVARSHLAECRAQIDALTKTIAVWEPGREVPWPTPGCADRVQRVDVPAAVEDHRYRTRTVPFTAAGFGGGFAVILLALRRRRRTTARAHALVELESWKNKLENAAARLLQLERDHALYLSASRPRWTGESAALDQRAADAVNRAFLLLSAASDLHRDAEATASSAGPLAVHPFERAGAMLSTTPVVFETGDVEKRRKVFLPLSERYEGTAAKLLDDLSQAYEQAAASLDAASGAMDRAAEVGSACVAAGERALASAKQRRELGYPTGRWAEALVPLLEERADAERAIDVDPLGAETRLSAARAGIEVIEARLTTGNRVALALAEAAQSGRALRETIARLQAEGFRLDEPELSPHGRLDRSAARGAEVRRLLANDEEHAAETTLAVVTRTLANIAADLERTEAARRDVPAACAHVREQLSSVRGRIAAAQEAVQRLEARHAPAAFAEQASALATMDAVLASAERAVARALVDHAEQRYLAARSGAEEGENAARRADAIVSAVMQVEARLDAAKSETAAIVSKNSAAIRALSDVLTRRGVSTTLAGQARTLVAAAEECAKRAAGERPHWLAVSAEATTAMHRLAEIDRELHAEILAWTAADDEARRAALGLEDLARQVEAESRDRAHVEEAVHLAHREIASVRERLAAARESGTALLEATRAASAKSAWAHEVWRTELDAIHSAERELANARRAVSRVQTRHYGSGVTPLMQATMRQLDRATAAEDARDWRGAFVAAEAARALADAEERSCEERVRVAERERLAALATPSISSWSSSSDSSSSSWSSSSSSSSSWGSSDSSSSSSSSSSSGSSYGSSDSGGSSYGSSDSGGSSW